MTNKYFTLLFLIQQQISILFSIINEFEEIKRFTYSCIHGLQGGWRTSSLYYFEYWIWKIIICRWNFKRNKVKICSLKTNKNQKNNKKGNSSLFSLLDLQGRKKRRRINGLNGISKIKICSNFEILREIYKFVLYR